MHQDEKFETVDLKYPDFEKILGDITNYCEKRIEEAGQIKHPKFSVNEENQITIVLDGNIIFNNFFPSELKVANIPGDTYAMAGGGGYFDFDGNMTEMNVEFDADWVSSHGTAPLCGVAHEFGHILSMKKSHGLSEQHEKTYQDYNYPFRNDEDIEKCIDRVLSTITLALVDEVEAYNYGKIVGDSFGIHPDEFESNILPFLKCHMQNIGFEAKKYLMPAIEEYEKTHGKTFSTEKVFKIYDITQQDEVELSYRQVLNWFDQYTQESVDDALDQAKERISAQ